MPSFSRLNHFVSIESTGEFIILTNNNKSFKVHRLLQEVIRTTLDLSTKDNNTKTLKNNIAEKKYHILITAMDLLKMGM